MDIETKEAVLKLAGYEIEEGGNARRSIIAWRVHNKEKADTLGYATTKPAAINLAYNTFLTRQNEVIES